MDIDVRKEYTIIKTLTSTAYKLYMLLKLLVYDGKVDSDGFVSMSYKQFMIKLGMKSNNISKLLKELETNGLIFIQRGDNRTINKYKLLQVNVMGYEYILCYELKNDEKILFEFNESVDINKYNSDMLY